MWVSFTCFFCFHLPLVNFLPISNCFHVLLISQPRAQQLHSYKDPHNAQVENDCGTWGKVWCVTFTLARFLVCHVFLTGRRFANTWWKVELQRRSWYEGHTRVKVVPVLLKEFLRKQTERWDAVNIGLSTFKQSLEKCDQAYCITFPTPRCGLWSNRQ